MYLVIADLLRLQDANECWTEIMRMMSEYLPGEGSTSTETVRKSFIEQYFGGENVTTLKCSESEEEPEAKSIEKWTQLRCHINTDVRYMQLGLTMVRFTACSMRRFYIIGFAVAAMRPITHEMKKESRNGLPINVVVNAVV